MAKERATGNVLDMATHSDLVGAVEEMGADKQPAAGLLRKIGATLRKAMEKEHVELPDGSIVTAAAARLIQEKGMGYIGTDIWQEVPVQGGPGMERWERYDERRHTNEQLAKRRFRIHEYLELPAGDKGRLCKGEKSPREIWLVRNGKIIGAIGHNISQHVLRRMGKLPEGAADVGHADKQVQSMVNSAP